MRPVSLPLKAHSLIDGIWFGTDLPQSSVRAALTPLSWIYGGLSSARNAAFDWGILPSRSAVLPVLSVGNLTVGGTGKTPVSSYIVSRLQLHSARPAIVMRGYGRDEILVHRRLNQNVPVIASPDRVAGAVEAFRRGADIVVLDDGFQHRRLARDVDLVLVSADAWRAPRRLLPAGPWREPLRALQRATAVIITRKSAGDEAVMAALKSVERAAPGLPCVVVRLEPGELRAFPDSSLPLSKLAGASVLTISAIGDPAAFERQIAAEGGRVTAARFADHHQFTNSEAEGLALAAAHHDIAVCTLKDAVKLEPLWPRAAASLWYVSQSVVVEHGGDFLTDLLVKLATSRPTNLPTAPGARLSSHPHGY